MTTDELVRLIEQVQAHIPWEGYDRPTIGMLASVAGTPTRAIEGAIQQARLEGVPIITDGGIRVAQDSAECKALSDWLFARIRSQRLTAVKVYLKHRKMRVEEDRAARLTLWRDAA